ncbi:hypothetical protein T08_7226 [Trichinella sp. T8]|nr:hypothetical protein T08_7226 [Trichinella sp. T8]
MPLIKSECYLCKRAKCFEITNNFMSQLCIFNITNRGASNSTVLKTSNIWQLYMLDKQNLIVIRQIPSFTTDSSVYQMNVKKVDGPNRCFEYITSDNVTLFSIFHYYDN